MSSFASSVVIAALQRARELLIRNNSSKHSKTSSNEKQFLTVKTDYLIRKGKDI
jgi:hypothetical protein